MLLVQAIQILLERSTFLCSGGGLVAADVANTKFVQLCARRVLQRPRARARTATARRVHTGGDRCCARWCLWLALWL